jgi:hypothetical protein
MVATYCSEQHVAAQLGLVDVDSTSTYPKRLILTSSTNPSKDEVTTFIEDAEEHLEERCHTAWKPLTITREKHSIYDQLVRRSAGDYYYSIQLNNRFCRTLDDAQSDELRVFEGGTFEEWLGVKTEGEAPGDGDYFFDHLGGRLYLNTNYPDRQEYNVEVTYRHGKSAVPASVRRATILLAAVYIIESGILDYQNTTMTDNDSANHQQKAELWRAEVERIIESKTVPLQFPQY